MKKVYCAPLAQTVALDCSSSILVGSAVIVKNNKRGNGVQLSNERQGDDWDDEVDE